MLPESREEHGRVGKRRLWIRRGRLLQLVGVTLKELCENGWGWLFLGEEVVYHSMILQLILLFISIVSCPQPCASQECLVGDMNAPPPDFTDAEVQKEFISLLEPDFHGLLQRKEVSAVTQARLAHANCKSLSRFNSVADSRVQLRTFAQQTVQLDPAADVMEVAALVDAWEAAKVPNGGEAQGRGRGV